MSEIRIEDVGSYEHTITGAIIVHSINHTPLHDPTFVHLLTHRHDEIKGSIASLL